MDIAISRGDTIIGRNSGKSEEMSLVIVNPSINGRTIAFLETDDGKKVRVYLTVRNRNEFTSGDIVTGKISLRIPTGDASSLNSFSNYLASQNVFLQANAESVKITGRYKKGIMGKIYSLRAKALAVAKSSFSGEHRALFCAMVLGDKSMISAELQTALQGSGLNHIAVVSGLHLSVVIAFIMLVTRKFFGKGRRCFVLAIMSAVFIALITGAGASVTRALIMCLLYYMARILYREQDGVTSLFCTVWIMTILNPYIIFNTGFVLSVLSVLGIILFSKKFCEFFRKLMPEKVADAISLTLSAQLVLTPVIVYYFGVVTPYAPFSNVLAVPLSAIYVILGMTLMILAPITPIATVLTTIINFLADGIIKLCESVSSLPFALYDFNGDFPAFLIGWIFLIIIIFYHSAPSEKNSNNKFVLQR